MRQFIYMYMYEDNTLNSEYSHSNIFYFYASISPPKFRSAIPDGENINISYI